MNPLVSVTAAADTAASGQELLYLAFAAMCLLLAMHYLRRMFVPMGELVRVLAAAAMIALSITTALVLLVAITIGGR